MCWAALATRDEGKIWLEMKRFNFQVLRHFLQLRRARDAADPVSELQEIQRRLAANILRLAEIRKAADEAAVEAHQAGLVAQRLQQWILTRRSSNDIFQ